MLKESADSNQASSALTSTASAKAAAIAVTPLAAGAVARTPDADTPDGGYTGGSHGGSAAPQTGAAAIRASGRGQLVASSPYLPVILQACSVRALMFCIVLFCLFVLSYCARFLWQPR